MRGVGESQPKRIVTIRIAVSRKATRGWRRMRRSIRTSTRGVGSLVVLMPDVWRTLPMATSLPTGHLATGALHDTG